MIAYMLLRLEGRLIGGIDENGIKYYNNLINELKANGKIYFINFYFNNTYISKF